MGVRARNEADAREIEQHWKSASGEHVYNN